MTVSRVLKPSLSSFFLVFAATLLLSLVYSVAFSSEDVAACGVNTGRSSSLAGLIVEPEWVDDSGTVRRSENTRVRVTTVTSGAYGGNHVVRTDSSNTSVVESRSSATFSQINYDGCGRNGNNVVLGYGRTSPAAHNGTTGWALDCQASRHGQGNEQPFDVTGIGTPTGARSGGTWEVKRVQPPNGFTTRITIRYTQPPPPDAGVAGLRKPAGDLTQNDVDGTPVRVRNPAMCGSSCDYNERDASGNSFRFDDVTPGYISITTATGAAGGEDWQIRYRTRMCSSWSTSDCSGWSSYSGWSYPDGYRNVNRNVPDGNVLRIQFQYREAPPPSRGSASSDCEETNGTVYLDYTGSVTVRFKAWIAGDSEPGWQQSRTYGSGFGESRRYSFDIPNSAKDAYSNTRTKVRVFYTPRSENNYTRNDTVGPCGLYFDYNPSLNVPNPATRPKPGQSITIDPRVSNCGESRCTTGRNYNYRLRITSGADNLVGYNTNTATLINTTSSGIPKGTTRNHNNWALTAKDDAGHGNTVCFEMEINPTRGQMWPHYYTHPDNAPRFDDGCFDIYNEQFELSDISISGDDSYPVPALDGTTLEIEVHVVNDGNVNNDPPSINNTGAKLGRSSGVTTTLEIYENGNPVPDSPQTFSGQIDPGSGGRTFTHDHHIANGTSNDTTYCFIAYANPTAGWSDGSDYPNGTAPFNDSPDPVQTSDNVDDCNDESRVATQSYFQVHRNDVASGMSIGRSDSPLSCDPMSNPERGFISGTMATRSGTREFGSFSEYAAYALGDIINFGTSVRGSGGGTNAEDFYDVTPGDNSLAFANTTGGDGGHLGDNAYRCMSNLFELLAKGSHDDVEDITGAGSINMTPYMTGGASPEGRVQLYSDSDITIHNGNVPSGGTGAPRFTLVVDGDITIEADVAMTNPKQYRGHGVALVASGDINIDNSVSKVDALLYAGGKLDTCAGVGELGTDVCGNQLTVTGMAIADRFDLKRTHGGVSAGRTEQPAEVFRFNPGIFTRPLYFVFAEDQPRPDLPIQEMVDLPPLF